ncbi:MAG: hypothetical protein Fur0041_04220 [Bacteroidia bacterium]
MRQQLFLLLYALFLLISGVVLLFSEKQHIHLFLNSYYSGVGDVLMPVLTDLGDGITITVLVLLLFARDRKFALSTGIACLVSGLITQLLKHTFFSGEPRPKLYFIEQTGSDAALRYVPGIENHLFDSFPSGHTTIAFAFFFALSFLFKKKYWQVIFFFLAFLIGYSRIYLSQHFLSDVAAGSVIGMIISLLTLYFFYFRNNSEATINTIDA